MSKISMNPLDYLRRSKTGAKIVAEIQSDDEAAQRRVDAVASVAEVDLTIADAEREYRKAAANETKSIEAARVAFNNAVAEARHATAQARSRVYSLTQQRDKHAAHLRASADVRIGEFKVEMQERFQSRRNSLPTIMEEVPGKKNHPDTGKPTEDVLTNGPARERWSKTILAAIESAEAMKLESLDHDEVETRLAALRAEVDAAEANAGEMTLAGERPGDALSAAIATAKPTITTPVRPRYQVIEEPELVG